MALRTVSIFVRQFAWGRFVRRALKDAVANSQEFEVGPIEYVENLLLKSTGAMGMDLEYVPFAVPDFISERFHPVVYPVVGLCNPRCWVIGVLRHCVDWGNCSPETRSENRTPTASPRKLPPGRAFPWLPVCFYIGWITVVGNPAASIGIEDD